MNKLRYSVLALVMSIGVGYLGAHALSFIPQSSCEAGCHHLSSSVNTSGSTKWYIFGQPQALLANATTEPKGGSPTTVEGEETTVRDCPRGTALCTPVQDNAEASVSVSDDCTEPRSIPLRECQK